MNSVQNVNKVILMFPNQAWYKFDLTTTWNLSPYVLCLLGEILIRRGYSIKIIDSYGFNDDNHYKSEKLDSDLPDEFTLDNGKYKIHSNIKERIIFLRENGLEKFDEWIKKEGI